MTNIAILYYLTLISFITWNVGRLEPSTFSVRAAKHGTAPKVQQRWLAGKASNDIQVACLFFAVVFLSLYRARRLEMRGLPEMEDKLAGLANCRVVEG